MINLKYYLPRLFLFFLIDLLSLTGCSIHTGVNLITNSFETDKYSHDILYNEGAREITRNPDDSSITYDYKMKFDGYILGIEKTYGVGDYPTKCLDHDFEEMHSSLCETVSSHKPNSIYGKNIITTHIVSFSPDDKSNTTCILFNAHDDIDDKEKSEITPCPNSRINTEKDKFEFTKEAINSIDLLKNDIRTRIEKKRPTHIFLVATGWNTPQGESIQNYNDLFTNIKKAADKENGKFEPLIVGVTWHSYIKGVPKGTADYAGSQNDADEVGLYGAGPILQEVLEPIGSEFHIPVRTICHSFGCRIVTQAVASNMLYGDPPNSSKPVSYGLQAAFSRNRFLSKEYRFDHDSLENFSEVSQKQFYTTSEHDTAVKNAPAHFVGDSDFFDVAGSDSKFQKIITLSTIISPGKYVPNLDCKGDKITLINASKIIKDPAPGTGGGAHSDVWDAEAGDLIWDLLKVCEGQ